MRFVCWYGAVLFPVWLGACSPASPHGDSPESAVPWFSLVPGDSSVIRRVGATPAWVLGSGADGASFIEPTGAIRLSDGTFVVADHRAGMLHYLTRDGHALRVVGGSGSGPGEFRSLEGIGIAGRDTVWTYDHALRRLTMFGKSGDVLVTHILRMTGRPSWPSVIGVVPGGRVIVLERNLPLPIGQPAGAVWRDSSRLLWYSLPLQSSSVSHEVPLFDTYIDAAGPRAGIAFIPFGPRFAVVASPSDNQVYFGFSESFRISRISATGGLKDFVERAFVGRAVTDEDLRRREARATRSPRTPIPKSAIPKRIPAFGRLLADWAGGLWVQEYEEDGQGLRWVSFDARGALRSIVILPRGFTLLLVDGNAFLGVQEDEDGVPKVALLRLPAH